MYAGGPTQHLSPNLLTRYRLFNNYPGKQEPCQTVAVTKGQAQCRG
jgi:hypothetical protein